MLIFSRKSSTKLSTAPQHNHGPLDPRLFSHDNNTKPVLQRSKTQYDWRQDTPFWNKPRNKPQVPANKPKLREEPWTHLHAGPTSLWPSGQPGYPGLFLGTYNNVYIFQTLVTVTKLTGKALDQIHVRKVFQHQHELCLHN